MKLYSDEVSARELVQQVLAKSSSSRTKSSLVLRDRESRFLVGRRDGESTWELMGSTFATCDLLDGELLSDALLDAQELLGFAPSLLGLIGVVAPTSQSDYLDLFFAFELLEDPMLKSKITSDDYEDWEWLDSQQCLKKLTWETHRSLIERLS